MSRVYLDNVIPEKSGIQGLFPLDSRLRGNDENAQLFMGHHTSITAAYLVNSGGHSQEKDHAGMLTDPMAATPFGPPLPFVVE